MIKSSSSSEIRTAVRHTSSKIEHLYDVQDRIQAANKVIENKAQHIEEGFRAWKAKALRIMEEYFEEQYQSYLRVHDAENKRLAKNLITVKEAIYFNKKLQKTSASLTKTGNIHDLQNLKEEINLHSKKLERLDASSLCFTTAESWKVVETNFLMSW